MGLKRNVESRPSREELQDVLRGLINHTAEQAEGERHEEIESIERSFTVIEGKDFIEGPEIAREFSRIANIFLETVRFPIDRLNNKFSDVKEERVSYLLSFFKESENNLARRSTQRDIFWDEFLVSFLDRLEEFKDGVSDDFVIVDQETNEKYYGIDSPCGVDYVQTLFSDDYSREQFKDFYEEFVRGSKNDYREIKFLLRTIVDVASAINELNREEYFPIEIMDPLNFAEGPLDVEIYKAMTDKMKKTDPQIATQEAVRSLIFDNLHEVETSPNLSNDIITSPQIFSDTDKIGLAQGLTLRLKDFSLTTLPRLNEEFNKLDPVYRNNVRDDYKYLIFQAAALDVKWFRLLETMDDQTIQNISSLYTSTFDSIVGKITNLLQSIVERNAVPRVAGEYGAFPFEDLAIQEEAEREAAELKDSIGADGDRVVILTEEGEPDIRIATPQEAKKLEEQMRRELREANPGMILDEDGQLTDGGNEGAKVTDNGDVIHRDFDYDPNKPKINLSVWGSWVDGPEDVGLMEEGEKSEFDEVTVIRPKNIRMTLEDIILMEEGEES